MSNLVTCSAPAGGAGTTTAVWHLAQVTAAQGEPVLVVDLSPSKALTHLAAVETDAGMAELLQGGRDVQSVIHKTRVDGLHILPAGGLHEMLLAEALSGGTLNHVLASLAEGPHPVFLDLPAHFPFLFSVASELSDWVLLSLPCRPEALSGLAGMLERLAETRRHRPSVGVVINRFAAWSRVEFEEYRRLRQTLPASALWQTAIPFDESFQEVENRGLPATIFAPQAPGPRAYFDLFGEWTARRAFLNASTVPSQTDRDSEPMAPEETNHG